MADPRISPGTRAEIGWLNWAIAYASGRVAGTTPPNLFLTLARHRRLFRGFDERGCIELLMLVGHYEVLATFLETLRVPQDTPR